MSLVGSLEDLSLGDILQIISLSQKSGVLSLRTTGQSGRIVFVKGLVRGAALKAGPARLPGVLVGGGFLDEASFELARAQAEEQAIRVAEALAANGSLSMGRIDSLCREAVESAVVEMFSWVAGDFSFDVRVEPEPDDPELLLPTGINAQYLAMEGARQTDEASDASEVEAHAGDEAPIDDDAEFDAMSAQEMFGAPAPRPGEIAVEGAPEPESNLREAVGLLAQSTLSSVDREPCSVPDWPADAGMAASDAAASEVVESDRADAETQISRTIDVGVMSTSEDPSGAEEIEPAQLIDLAEADVIGERPELGDGPVVAAAQASEADESVASPAPGFGRPSCDAGPLVVLDEDLVVLEWVKRAVEGVFSPIHIFQQADQGLARIRQYLVRGMAPLVVLSPRVHVDPLGGIRDAADFVARLKAQSSRLEILWLCGDGDSPPRRFRPADGSLIRPDASEMRPDADPDADLHLATDFRGRLQVELERIRSNGPDGSAVDPSAEAQSRFGSLADPALAPESLRRLAEVTQALTDASSRGEVLPLVIRFASEIFDRVAMFLVRDGVAVGMAEFGLAACGGPTDAALRAVQLDTESSAWMRAVLEARAATTAPPCDEGDRALAAALGDRIPSRAYLAPIESADRVIALLYGDNLPDDGPIGDTSALEVVLHHAGLALERAALERALPESDEPVEAASDGSSED